MEPARGLYNALAISFIVDGLVLLWIFHFQNLRDWTARTHANGFCWGFIILGVVMIVAIVIAGIRNRSRPST